MIRPFRSAWRLYQVYGLRRIDGTPSTAAFWYLPEPARVTDAAQLQAYHASASPSPLYLMDYQAKLGYHLTDDHDIITLNYGPPLGRQLNPEAAFQFALGLHDRFRLHGSRSDCQEFVRYATFFLKHRDSRGRWLYRFPWFQSPNPWYSALAQSRGASTMVRAWLLTGDEAFRVAALEAVANFGTAIEDGGFRAIHPRAAVPYLEEYPFEPSASINGLLAALFGLYEVARWTGDARAAVWFEDYLDGVSQIVTSHTLRWWSIYDFDPSSPFVNIHSPRYHRLVIDYLLVLAVIGQRPGLADAARHWGALDRWPSRLAALGLKGLKKAIHR